MQVANRQLESFINTRQQLYLKELVGLDIAVVINRLIVKLVKSLRFKMYRWYPNEDIALVRAYCSYFNYNFMCGYMDYIYIGTYEHLNQRGYHCSNCQRTHQ